MSSRSSLYPSILGLSGKIGSGKDYIVQTYILPYLKSIGKTYQIIAFADYLKVVCNVKDRILYTRLFVKKDEESRKTLQTRGTLERVDNPDIFIDVVKCMMRLAFERGVDVVIVPDVRYTNELHFLLRCGATVFRLNAPKRTVHKTLEECGGDSGKASIVSAHKSEIDLDDNREFQYYIDNDYSNSENVGGQIAEILKSLYNES
jgi:guanylate kinase